MRELGEEIQATVSGEIFFVSPPMQDTGLFPPRGQFQRELTSIHQALSHAHISKRNFHARIVAMRSLFRRNADGVKYVGVRRIRGSRPDPGNQPGALRRRRSS